jgi:hypothetical protein
VKTHKQRVEELNKYLSTLSEHHDMYVFASLPPPFFSLFFSTHTPHASIPQILNPLVSPRTQARKI